MRDLAGCHQVVAVTVEGRTAPDGYLTVTVETGASYADDREVFVVGGESIRWHIDNPSGGLRAPRWRFDEAAVAAADGRAVAPYLDRSVVPALDAFDLDVAIDDRVRASFLGER